MIDLGLDGALMSGSGATVFGVSKDKDVQGMMPHIARSQNLIILTQANNPRAMDVDTLEQKIFLSKED